MFEVVRFFLVYVQVCLLLPSLCLRLFVTSQFMFNVVCYFLVYVQVCLFIPSLCLRLFVTSQFMFRSVCYFLIYVQVCLLLPSLCLGLFVTSQYGLPMVPIWRLQSMIRSSGKSARKYQRTSTGKCASSMCPAMCVLNMCPDVRPQCVGLLCGFLFPPCAFFLRSCACARCASSMSVLNVCLQYTSARIVLKITSTVPLKKFTDGQILRFVFTVKQLNVK